MLACFQIRPKCLKSQPVILGLWIVFHSTAENEALEKSQRVS